MDNSDSNEQSNVDGTTKSALRWVRYISLERRVLWYEYPVAHNTVPYLANIPDAPEWKNTIDAAFATRLPQRNDKIVNYQGQPIRLYLKVFPDYGVGGQFKGVIQVVETGPENRGESISDITPQSREVHSVLDLTLCGVVLYRPEEDRIQNVNRRLAQETGYAVTDLEGMSGRILFGDDGASLLKNIYHRLMNAGEGVVCGQSLAVRDRQGRREQYYCSLILIPSRPDNHEELVLYVSLDGAEKDDVTGIVRAGPNPRFVLEALQEGLWEYDAAKQVFHYSRCYSDIFGPEGEPGGPGKPLDNWFNTIYPGEPERVIENWRNLLKKGRRYRTFYRIRDPKGEWRWIMSTIHAILNDARGRPIRIIGFHMDITDAMQSEKNLSDAEDRLRVIFENSGVGICLAEADGSNYRVNAALALMLGRDREEFVGKWLSDFAHPDYREEMLRAYRRLMKGGRREIMKDILFARPDGREVWLDLTASLSRKTADGNRYAILTAEDVTNAKITREKLQYEATHDVMTGAWSRWVMLERLEQHIHLALRHNQPMTFCLCDLDNFKMINDLHGHQAGDQVLIRFVEILKQELRDTDLIGRYGGEEFGVVMPNTPIAGAHESLERVLACFRKEIFSDAEESTFGLSATIGVAGVIPGCDSKQVIAWADAALYDGKGGGRDRIIVAKPPKGEWL